MTLQETATPKQIGDSLLEDLTGTPTSAVGEASRKANDFTEEDEGHDRRRGKAERRRTFQKIQRWFFWFLFWFVCAIIIACSAGYLFLVWKWVSTLIWDVKIHNAVGLKQFIDGVLFSLMIIFATLFLEGTFRDKHD